MMLDYQTSLLTIFHTPLGMYRWTRCPFGLMNGPSELQSRMDDIFKDEKDIYGYADDILGSGNEHTLLIKLYRVLTILRDNKIKLKLTKCLFNEKKIEYLGREVSEHGVKLSMKHTNAFLQMSPPENKSKLLSYLGLLNVFSNNVKNLAAYTSKFTDLRKKNEKYTWTKRHQAVFNLLQKEIQSLPIFHFPDLSPSAGRFWIETDASQTCLGAFLCQEQNGQLVPISYMSRQLTSSMRNWHISELELQSIIFGTQFFHHYLIKPFIIINDHQIL